MTIALRCGLTPVPVRVDEDGIDVDTLAATGARAVVVTPAHQCPDRRGPVGRAPPVDNSSGRDASMAT